MSVIVGSNPWQSMERAFMRCSNLGSVGYSATDAPDLVSVTNMSNMFSGCPQFNGDIGSWNTANVTDMSSMFYGAASFNQDISGWDNGQVNDMTSMFELASTFNQDLSGWCVTLIPSAPTNFDTGATAWTLPASRPDWGNCPHNVTFRLYSV
jgi:surface protein